MKTYIVIATNEEKLLLDQLVPNHYKYELIVTGVGGLNVYESLSKIKKNSRIINIGYAGSNYGKIGDVYQVKGVQLFHPNCKFDSPRYELSTDDSISFKKIECFTAGDFVINAGFLKKKAVFDMELAFICAMGFKEVISYKVVSDNLNVSQYEENVGKKE